MTRPLDPASPPPLAHGGRALAGWRSRRARHLELRGLLLGWACAALLFSLWPELDLWVSQRFQGDTLGDFPWRQLAWVDAVYLAVPWLGRLAFVACLVLAWRGWRQGTPGRSRRALALALGLLLGVTLLVHGVFKEHWGRARPIAVAEFGGAQHFTPALLPADECKTNCSFVSGHAATGFVLMAVGLMAAPAVRWQWWRVGLAAGAAIGLVRIAQGGHFLSDIVFGWLIIWTFCLGLRALWLRWVRRRQRLARALRQSQVD